VIEPGSEVVEVKKLARDPETGEDVDLRGKRGRVLPVNAVWHDEKTDREMIGVQLESGAVVGLPQESVRPVGGGHVRRVFAGLGEAWERIFGR